MKLRPTKDIQPALNTLLILKYGPGRVSEVDTSAIEETGHLRVLLDGRWTWTRISLKKLRLQEDLMQIPFKERIPRVHTSSSQSPQDQN